MRQPIPFGKYYLLDRVNVGGMAEVFKAKATGVEGFERMVAVKRILPSIAEDEEFITMFIDEAKIAVQLTHANIAQIFDLGRVDDSYFIALEYVHGKDLRAIFNRGRARGEQVPIAMACFVVMKLCEGLDYAHNKRDPSGQFLNLVHRDISPQNILVSHEGEVKVIDFGIAKAAGKVGRTQAGILKGKFGYMSPEQVQGFEIDRRSDVFGVGIVLYELLTGERLFIGESDFATLEKVRNVDILPPSTHNQRIPEELEQIVLKALARDRNARHQTAMQLHDELQGFMYSSGNYFGRRDLSMYMHRAFSEEISRESARDQEYAALGGEVQDDITGLTAFDEIEPVSTVSALQPQPYLGAPAPEERALAAPPYKRANKSTLLGLPTAGMGASITGTMRPQSGAPRPRSAPMVPPLVPRVESIPPSQARLSSSQPPGDAPRLEMEWDEEEMSTQIYDRPEDRTPGAAFAQASAPMVSNRKNGVAPMPARSLTPVPLPAPRMSPMPSAGPGAPSPFVQPVHRASAPSAGYAMPAEPDVAWPPARRKTQRTPMLVAGLSALAIVALIVLGVWLFGQQSAGIVHLSTEPSDVSVTIDGVPQLGTSPFVFSNVSAGAAHEIVISKQGYSPWISRFQLQAGETMQLPPVRLPALESGFALDSSPSGASVFVDGRLISTLTPVRVADLGPGQHQIRVEAEGHAPWESSLHVTPGTVLDLPIAQLTVTGGSPTDTAALPQDPAPAPPAVVRPQRSPPARRFTPRLEVPQVEPQPEAEPIDESRAERAGGTGTLRVQTRPWSNVLVDGRAVGTTPLMGLQLNAGRHTLTFVNDQFGISKTVKIDIVAGQTLTQSLTLE